MSADNAKMIDFYQVLGIENREAPHNDIRKSYIQLASKYHPDKPKGDEQLYKLIQRAWECLGNKEKRKEYDTIFANTEKSQKSDYNTLKKGFEHHKEISKNDTQSKEAAKKAAEIEFNKSWEELNTKRNFDQSKLKEAPINIEDAKQRYGDMILQRESDEIEFTQNSIFNEKNWSLGKFNAAFDMYKKTEDNKGELITSTTGPVAFNEVGSSMVAYTKLDLTDSLIEDYNGEEDNSLYGRVDFGKDTKIKIDVNKLSEANYTKEHNKLDSNYKNDLEKMLRDREKETSELGKLKLTEFKTAPKDGYMFTYETQSLTHKPSKEYEWVTNTAKIGWDNNDNSELVEACKKLVDLEKR